MRASFVTAVLTQLVDFRGQLSAADVAKNLDSPEPVVLVALGMLLERSQVKLHVVGGDLMWEADRRTLMEGLPKPDFS